MSRKENAFLVSVAFAKNQNSLLPIEESLNELSRLVATAGANVFGQKSFRRDKPSPNLYVGKGQAGEIAQICYDNDIDLLIFDDDLHPVQTRNLQDKTKARVLDRSQLILDIFARNARSHQAQLQVELAQLKYLYPRLSGQWTHFSKQVGGIGVRGPGETQLEVDRRRMQDRISKLIQLLKDIAVNKETQRKKRVKLGIPQVALIGYTNAGKSTLFNRITKDSQLIQDKLFATLDTVIRQVHNKDKMEFLLSDTVGFIHKLPHHLIESFKTTLAETALADVLLIVLDVSDPYAREKIEIVKNVLLDIGLQDKSLIFVYNKADLISPHERTEYHLKKEFGGVFVSALEDWGIDQLLQKIEKDLDNLFVKKKMLIPMSDLKWVSFLEDHGQIIWREFVQEGCLLEAKFSKAYFRSLEKYALP